MLRRETEAGRRRRSRALWAGRCRNRVGTFALTSRIVVGFEVGLCAVSSGSGCQGGHRLKHHTEGRRAVGVTQAAEHPDPGVTPSTLLSLRRPEPAVGMTPALGGGGAGGGPSAEGGRR